MAEECGVPLDCNDIPRRGWLAILGESYVLLPPDPDTGQMRTAKRVSVVCGTGGGGGTVDTIAWANQYGMSANIGGTGANPEIEPVGTEGLVKTIAQIGHGLTLGQAVRMNGGAYVAAQGTAAGSACAGFVLEVVSANQFRVLLSGHSASAPAAMFSGLTAGTAYYLSPSSAGALTATPNAFGIVLIATSTTAGYVVLQGVTPLTYYNGVAEVLQEAIITGVTDSNGELAINMSGAPYNWTNIRSACVTNNLADPTNPFYSGYIYSTANTGIAWLNRNDLVLRPDIPLTVVLKGA